MQDLLLNVSSYLNLNIFLMFSYAHTGKPDGLFQSIGFKKYSNISTFLQYTELQQTYS